MALEVEYPPAQACVWMTAGVISFRLCNRAFRCDTCPLHAALRGAAPTPARLPKKPARKPEDQTR